MNIDIAKIATELAHLTNESGSAKEGWSDGLLNFLQSEYNLETEIFKLYSDCKTSKEKEVERILTNIFLMVGMDAPENIEEISKFCLEDVNGTADPIHWSDGDVLIAFRRWIELQSTKPINVPQWSKFESKNAQEEGWDIFFSNRRSDGDWELQCVDEANVFSNDAEAWYHVRKGANKRKLSRNALKFIQYHNEEEYLRIISKS
jgi:hypothetical protein